MGGMGGKKRSWREVGEENRWGWGKQKTKSVLDYQVLRKTLIVALLPAHTDLEIVADAGHCARTVSPEHLPCLRLIRHWVLGMLPCGERGTDGEPVPAWSF